MFLDVSQTEIVMYRTHTGFYEYDVSDLVKNIWSGKLSGHLATIVNVTYGENRTLIQKESLLTFSAFRPHKFLEFFRVRFFDIVTQTQIHLRMHSLIQ